jgi:hypothetical protein
MKSGQHEMSSLGRCERDPHRFRIAHLSDDDHIRSLSDGSAQRGRKVWRVHANLYLLDDRALVLVFVLNRVFDRDDVPCGAAVDVVHQRRQRRRFARPGWPPDEHQSARKLRQQFDRRRQPKCGETRNTRRQQPDCRGASATFTVKIDSEAPNAAQAKGCINDVRVAIDPARVRRKCGQNGVLDIDAIEGPFRERQHSAVNANRWRRAGNEQQIASTTGRQQAKPSFDTRQIAG